MMSWHTSSIELKRYLMCIPNNFIGIYIFNLLSCENNFGRKLAIEKGSAQVILYELHVFQNSHHTFMYLHS